MGTILNRTGVRAINPVLSPSPFYQDQDQNPVFQNQDQDLVVQDQNQDQDFSLKTKIFYLTTGDTLLHK